MRQTSIAHDLNHVWTAPMAVARAMSCDGEAGNASTHATGAPLPSPFSSLALSDLLSCSQVNVFAVRTEMLSDSCAVDQHIHSGCRAPVGLRLAWDAIILAL